MFLVLSRGYKKGNLCLVETCTGLGFGLSNETHYLNYMFQFIENPYQITVILFQCFQGNFAGSTGRSFGLECILELKFQVDQFAFT